MARNKLLDLPADQFRSLVDADVRRRAQPELERALRDPSVAKRWYLVLSEMKKSVEGQIGAKRSEVIQQLPGLTGTEREKAWADFHRWRSGSLRFRTGVEERISEARYLMDANLLDESRRLMRHQRNAALAAVHAIETAVLRHRHEVEATYEPTAVDIALWDTVERLLQDLETLEPE